VPFPAHGTLVLSLPAHVPLSVHANRCNIFAYFHQTSQVMLELSQNRSAVSGQARISARHQQSRKLLIALGLLLVALVAVLINDRQFWFGTEQATIESDMPETQPVAQTAPAPAAIPAKPVTVPAARKPVSVPKVEVNTTPAEPPAVATTRTALPPLDVEVVAGSKHSEIHPPAPAKVEVPSSSLTASSIQPAPSIQPITEAAQREPITRTAAIQPPQASYRTTYPVLAQHMNVQGSVVLQAVISADGLIEDLRVLSGPAILSAAAQQAVREWRFKPMFQNGQAVESKAKITVNFSI
jgi:protein TonB